MPVTVINEDGSIESYSNAKVMHANRPDLKQSTFNTLWDIWNKTNDKCIPMAMPKSTSKVARIKMIKGGKHE